jgi:hypothetical protein
VALINCLREAGELEVEGGAVGLHRGCDLGPEEPSLEPAEAADGAEALSLTARRLDRGGPVGLDAERGGLDRIALAAGGEDDRCGGDPVEAPLQQHTRLLGRQAPDLDPSDRDAIGDPRSRAGEREADQSGENREQRKRDQHPAGEESRGAAGSRPGLNGCRINAHEVGQCSHRAGGQSFASVKNV